MQPKVSIITGQSDNIIDVEQKTVYSTDEISGSQNYNQMIQNILLIWLDQNIDDNNSDCCNTIRQLRRVINSVHTYKDEEECIEFLQRIDIEKVCMIISGSQGQNIVPRVHSMSQVVTIFIFCNDKKPHEQWVHAWSKIKGVFTIISPICEGLKQTAQECEQNAISISFLNTSDGLKKDLDQLEPSFMYIQIIKEILLDITFEPKHTQQYIEYCRTIFADNDKELQNIKRFERKYREETPIYWYTLECFLYPMLNRALRLMDIDIIIKMAFFIKDLYRHIEQLHQTHLNGPESNNKFIVYRGQGMSKAEFEQMCKTQGGLISFNNFLSTSKNRQVSLNFANRALANTDLVGILFIMTIDPSQSTTPFASIKDVSAMRTEDEVLFAIQTVFRIDDIIPLDENPRLSQVNLTLTNSDDKDLRQLTDYIREETCPNVEGWYRLGTVLLIMGQFEKAEEMYKILLEQTMNEREKAGIYHQLGLTKCDQGKYEEALKFYEKTVEIYEKSVPSNNLDLASTCNNIGMIYCNIGEYSKALSYYETAVEIWQQLLPPNHSNLASSYTNLGVVYRNMGQYSLALMYYEKALEIKQQSLPSNHPSLANSYANIGSLCGQMEEYEKALFYLERTLEIQEQSLPPNHPNLAKSYTALGPVYYALEEYSKSIAYHKKAIEIQRETLHSYHPDLAGSYINIGNVYDNLGEYLTALSYYEKALEIRQQSLPSNHPELATSYMNIGNVYSNMYDYSKALSYYEKSLEIKQQSLPPYHPDLAASSYNMGLLYENMGNFLKARSFYEQAINIAQQSLPSNHPKLQMCRNSLENVNKKL